MTSGEDGGLRAMVALCTAILAATALTLAESIFVPIGFALFVIALVWPIQRAAQAWIPTILALLLTVLAALVVLTLLGLTTAWSFGRVARWIIADAAQLQALYTQKLDWLEMQGIAASSMIGESFDARWLVRVAQGVIRQLQNVVNFLAVTLVFIILGLLEVEVLGRQLARMGRTSPAAAGVLRAGIRTAAKLRAYMLVRTAMSIATGLAVWGYARAVGLDLALEWGVIAFVLNYIPFIGPLVATLFPTVFSVLQFGTWEAALTVFLALQAIQFLSGSYLEPRLAGARLMLSPFVVLVAVFLGAFLWGIPGAFLGVPALIAACTLCEEFPGARWAACLLSGREPDEE